MSSQKKPKTSTKKPDKKKKALSNNEKIIELLKTLPEFCTEYFRGIGNNTSSKTRISYAYDLRVFFNYLLRTDDFKAKTMKDLSVNDLEKIKVEIFESFLYDLDKEHFASEINEVNEHAALARKLFAIRSLYKYFYRKQKITYNPSVLVNTPKVPEKAIIYLEPDEVAKLLDFMEGYEKILPDGRRKEYFLKTKLRDIAIITLFLGTGIRVSELVGIDRNSIDYSTNKIPVTRKGGDTKYVIFNDEVRTALLNYDKNVREYIITEDTKEKALFLSIQKKRISVDAVEELVQKYTKLCFPSKTITPHKLRSTFATNMLESTQGNIAVVSELLNHKSIETTKRRYSKVKDLQQYDAVNKYRLR